MSKRILLITGATGNQGGAVIRSLLDHREDHDWEVRAFVRDPASARAQALEARGVQLVKGDLDDEASVAQSVRDAYGVFSVQSFQPQGVVAEERQGKLLATAAAEAGVSHFVYSSTSGVDTDSGVPHYEGKWQIEQHIRSLELPATILRPVMFMENLERAAFRAMVMSLWKTYVPDTKPLQLIDVNDIGGFVSAAFADPERFIGQTISLAGDSLTRPLAIEALKRGGRSPLFSVRLPGPMRKRIPAEITTMFTWIGEVGFDADIPALRQIGPELKTLERWASLQAA
jgi:uncharacterized protein YbjT (DUF2867 family)